MPKKTPAEPRRAAKDEVTRDGAAALPADGFVRERLVLRVVPISRAQLWREVKARRFPAPVKLSERVTAWRVRDVRDWIESKGVAA